MNPRFPLFVISKNRYQYERRLTNRWLESKGIPHHLVVEESEYDQYAAVIDSRITTLLVLDDSYKDRYDACDDYGLSKSKGSGPARNFSWDYSINHLGAEFHWMIDDNIRGFYVRYNGIREPAADGTPLYLMESFALRYENLVLSGPHYTMFVPDDEDLPPVLFNTRVYSCLLVKNDIPFRWRGRYNEDTIISLDILKAGLCTAQHRMFMQRKITTQTIGGGNMDEVYKDGTIDKSAMLVREHPDVARPAERFGRPHHFVDYRPFAKNKLIRREGIGQKMTGKKVRAKMVARSGGSDE